MSSRPQRTLRQSVETQGVSLFHGLDVRVRFQSAPPNHGIVFLRTDIAGAPPVPARIEFVTASHRRTVIAAHGVQVEMIEHVMAALAGLHIDNCLIEVDGPELPGFDGSCREVCDLLLATGIEEQDELRECVSLTMPVRIRLSEKGSGTFADDQQSLVFPSSSVASRGFLTPFRTASETDDAELVARPMNRHGLAITYQLDYGDRAPIPPQNLTVEVTPETFVREIAFARTFVLQAEIAALQAAGYGQRMTYQDLVVFDSDGRAIDNELRAADEPVRHKILDCLGDSALIGADLRGYVNAYRTGHRHNHELIRRVQLTHQDSIRSEAV